VNHFLIVPFNLQVLPIFFGGLPLKNDPIENKPAFRAIFYLFENQSQLVLPHIDHLLSVFAYVLDPSKTAQISEETKARLVELLQALRQEMPQKVAAAGL
jgi:hypothetical protein